MSHYKLYIPPTNIYVVWKKNYFLLNQYANSAAFTYCVALGSNDNSEAAPVSKEVASTLHSKYHGYITQTREDNFLNPEEKDK